MEQESDAYRYAIKNAFLHNGKADLKAVIGKILALHKDADLKKLMPMLQETVKKVNEMSFEEIKAEYGKFEDGYELKPPPKKEGLPELDWEGGVVTRFAPNPNGPFHLGNARAAILSYKYAEKYGGKFILRFEDTDPKVKKPIRNAEGLFKEDLEWLGCKIDETYFASDRLDIYYEHMRMLLDLEKAYVCTCKSEEWREKISKKEACPCRNGGKKEQVEMFEKMLSNELKEGEAVLRIKTDLVHPDPSVRDWWVARIVDEPNHPRVGGKYHVWPSYMFQSTVDDHLMGVTLILRGQEHEQNQTKQEYLYSYFGWVYPHAMHFGRIALGEMVLSTSKIAKGIEEGKYTGWDDPRLGTIRALRRRGFDARALVDVIVELGPKSSDTTIEFLKLADLNKKYVEEYCKRIPFIQDPVQVDVIYASAKQVKRNGKTIELADGNQSFLVPRNEVERIKDGEVFRLKEAYNVKILERDTFKISTRYSGDAMVNRPIVQWVLEGTDVEVLMPDGTKAYGISDANGLEKGEIAYLDKFGYARVDKMDEKRIYLVFAHK